MDRLKRRLNDLWRRETAALSPPHPWPIQFPDVKMLVTICEPMKISGMVLLPGRYVFRPLDPGTDRSPVQIFNDDQTRLLATVTPGPNG
jgi:hypothetical protein